MRNSDEIGVLHWRIGWQKLRIRYKVLALFVLLSAIVLGLISLPNYLYLKKKITENSRVYSVNTADQVKTSIFLLTSRLEEIVAEQVKHGFLSSGNVQPLADDATTLVGRIEYLQNNLLYPFIGFDEIFFQSVSGSIYAKDSYSWNTDELTTRMLSFLRANQEIIYSYWGEGLWFSLPEFPNRLYFSRAIYVRAGIEPLGILVCGTPLSFMEQNFQGFDALRGGDIFVYNREHNLIYANDTVLSQVVHPFLQEELRQGKTTSAVRSISGNSYLTTWASSPDKRFYICHITSLSELYWDVTIIRVFMIVVAAVTFLLSLGASFTFSLSLTNRLSKLIERIHFIEQGHWDTRVVSLGLDEIGELGIAFNGMTENLDRSIKIQAQQEVKAIKAEYTALQSQINPHFLFNLLESINSMAKLEANERISDAITILARLFRKTVRTNQDLISVHEEVSYIKDYLYLHTILMGNRLSVEWDVDDGIDLLSVPKFILQPLVENAVKYGLEEKQSGGLIIISLAVSPERDVLVMEVSDNGIGMCRHDINRITSEIRNHVSLGRHIGLSGTGKRLDLLFGEKASLDIRSEQGIGTTVSIRIPIYGKGEVSS